MDETKISQIIKQSVKEATEPVVKRVDEVADTLTTLVAKVMEQDEIISGLITDNSDKSQLITEQRDIISEQQTAIDDLRAKLEAALSENRLLKEEKVATTELLDTMKEKLVIAVPKFEHKDYASQFEEIGCLLDMVEFVPKDVVNEQLIENSELKDELTETKSELSEVKNKLQSVQRENEELRKDIDRLNARAEIAKAAEVISRTENAVKHDFDISLLEQDESPPSVGVER
jgi:septal ring factor EnvC (AmiA/AmiB activator)